MFTDSHCHLNFPELMAQLPAIRQAMDEARVDRALCISTTMESFPQVHALAQNYVNFWATVGVHPDEENVTEPSVEDLLAALALPKVLAVGETGLDYYQMQKRKGGRSVADLEWQRQRFRVHIRAAKAANKPLVIHTRSAAEDTFAILREEQAEANASFVGGVFHCFTESLEVAKKALDMGYFISFSGILTFKAAQSLRNTAAYVPLTQTLIETDSPYLAPTPHRGKTNTPAWVPLVAQQLAAIKQVEAKEVGLQTSANFDRLFQPSAALLTNRRTHA